MKRLKIEKIVCRQYEGKVYNIHLESDSKEDDLFWVEQNTGIITHNCFPKDINALIHVMQDSGIDPKILSAVWDQNKALRQNWDWADIKGAVSDGSDE